jgi:hypothetical protein
MGSSLSPVVANMFMEHFNTLSLNSFHLKPKFVFIFVDDTFIVWPHGPSFLISFLNHLNGIPPISNLIWKFKKKTLFPFWMFLSLISLMALSSTKFIGRITHRDRYLHAQSHHNPAQKSIFIKNLVTQTIQISSPQFLKK